MNRFHFISESHHQSSNVKAISPMVVKIDAAAYRSHPALLFWDLAHFRAEQSRLPNMYKQTSPKADIKIQHPISIGFSPGFRSESIKSNLSLTQWPELVENVPARRKIQKVDSFPMMRVVHQRRRPRREQPQQNPNLLIETISSGRLVINLLI